MKLIPILATFLSFGITHAETTLSRFTLRGEVARTLIEKSKREAGDTRVSESSDPTGGKVRATRYRLANGALACGSEETASGTTWECQIDSTGVVHDSTIVLSGGDGTPAMAIFKALGDGTFRDFDYGAVAGRLGQQSVEVALHLDR